MAERFETQSRRQVQRRFPPGSYAIGESRYALYLIIAWTQLPAVKRLDGTIRNASSWEATVVVGNARIEHLRWESVRGCWTIEEWEECCAS